MCVLGRICEPFTYILLCCIVGQLKFLLLSTEGKNIKENNFFFFGFFLYLQIKVFEYAQTKFKKSAKKKWGDEILYKRKNLSSDQNINSKKNKNKKMCEIRM